MASPIISWALPPVPLPLLYNLSVNMCSDGVPVAVWWSMLSEHWVLGPCQQPPSQRSSFEDLFLFPLSQL